MTCAPERKSLVGKHATGYLVDELRAMAPAKNRKGEWARKRELLHEAADSLAFLLDMVKLYESTYFPSSARTRAQEEMRYIGDKTGEELMMMFREEMLRDLAEGRASS